MKFPTLSPRLAKTLFVRLILVCAILASLAGLFSASSQEAKAAVTFTNPLNGGGPDPWMTYYNGNYYLATTTWYGASTGVTMRKAPTINALKVAPQVRVWQDNTASRCCNYWAPEFDLINGHWYMYFSGGTSTCCDNQRIWVLESASTDPMGPYSYKGQLTDSIGGWMIDQSIMTLNGSLYLLFSAWSGSNQNVYIAPMSNPWTVSGSRVLISTPTYSWEIVGGRTNEGPVALQHGGKTFVVYSASSCATASYALGQLTYTGSNPLLTASWTKKSTPIFSQANGVYGPAHNGFFKSPDGTEDWIVYHGNSSSSQGCDSYRTTRIQKFTWNADGTPNLGSPVSTSTALNVPSGESGAATPPTYTIRNRNSGKCLDVQSPNIFDGANIGQYTCNGGNWQRFAVVNLGNGYNQITSVHSGKVVEVAGCSTANGGNVAQFSWLNNNCQQWQFVTTTSPYIQIINRNSGKVLDVVNCSTADAANVDQWAWLNNNCQQWQLVP